MKHINKNIANEPQSLREYREITPNTQYDGGNFDAKVLKQSLLEEQGYICAYCMGRISLDLNENHKPKIEVEHLKPREKYPELELQFNNMLGVCNGLSISHPEKIKNHHCDKTQGNEGKMNGQVEFKAINPLYKDKSENLLTYTINGEIKPKSGSPDIEHDLNKVLNLNNAVLIKNRKVIIDKVLDDLKKEKSIQQWTVAFFEKHIELWSIRHGDEGKFRQYCMVAIWFLNNLKSKSKYQ
jgi:uncharacterized protein (TIGR02646 family)